MENILMASFRQYGINSKLLVYRLSFAYNELFRNRLNEVNLKVFPLTHSSTHCSIHGGIHYSTHYGYHNYGMFFFNFRNFTVPIM